MAASQILCGNRDCRIAETGKCVEGLTKDTCPNFGRHPSALASNESPANQPHAVTLSAAGRLSADEAAAALRREEGRVIAVIGPHDAGKTSLIAGLYDLFQRGPIGSSHFNGSRTLHAFEMACHDARAASERNVPHINRTPLGDAEYFHLGITQFPLDLRLALLIADRAGEDYRSAANDVEIVANFHEVKRADTLTFLVDGQRLEQGVTRHQVRSELLRLVQALVDGGVTSPRQQLAIVLTKLDEIQASNQAERVLADFATDIGKLRTIFPRQFASIEPFRVAASPKKVTVERGAGLQELLKFWLGSPTWSAEANALIDEPLVDARVFRRLKYG